MNNGVYVEVCKQQKRLFKLNVKTKRNVVQVKVTYIGICILKLRKVLTYEFYCDYIKNTYGNNLRRLFNDTDSLMY